jgi:hypothetical protein
MSFQVAMAASTKITAFWVVALCSFLEVDRRFRGTYCLHNQDDANHVGDISSTCLGNVGLLLQDYTEPFSRRLSSSS